MRKGVFGFKYAFFFFVSIKSNCYAGSYGYDDFGVAMFNSRIKKWPSGWQ